MTTADKPVTRKTLSRGRYKGNRSKDIVVTIHPTWLSFRLLGTRKEYLLDIEHAYARAVKLEAINARQEKLKAKAAAKKGNA